MAKVIFEGFAKPDDPIFSSFWLTPINRKSKPSTGTSPNASDGTMPPAPKAEHQAVPPKNQTP